jgi:hypothetical protein
MDAFADIDARGISFHSRGGTTSTLNARNTEYGPALRVLLKRIASSGIKLNGVWVDSSLVQGIPISERTVLLGHELDSDGSSAFTLITKRMMRVGQEESSKGGNSTKKLRLQFESEMSVPLLETELGLVRVDRDLRALDRLPVDELKKVRANHIWRALQMLSDPTFRHPFGPSTDFDLVANGGERFPPKAVFGTAASEALGFEVLPKHFAGGLGSPCFAALTDAGYEIVSKGQPSKQLGIPPTDEDKRWSEGKVKLVSHLIRERATGLAQAKKDQFILQNGKLYCERCGMDPTAVYGDLDGSACIEVHHHATHVAAMAEDHQTKLEDLQCLCANCHRIVHRELKRQLTDSG